MQSASPGSPGKLSRVRDQQIFGRKVGAGESHARASGLSPPASQHALVVRGSALSSISSVSPATNLRLPLHALPGLLTGRVVCLQIEALQEVLEKLKSKRLPHFEKKYGQVPMVSNFRSLLGACEKLGWRKFREFEG